MQAQGYIQSVGDEVESFWKESNGLAEENDMDQNLAYMFTMIQKAHGKVIFNKKALMDYGAKVQLFPGVETWFKRIRDYGMERGVIVEHYIISSGLKEMIEGTKVANEFEKFMPVPSIMIKMVLLNGQHKLLITRARLNSFLE